MSKRYLNVKRVSLAVAALFLMCGLIYLIDRALGLNVGGRLSQLRSKVSTPAFFERDDRLGWRHKPGARATRHESEYTATYTTGPDGDRIVPGVPSSGPVVAFLGCSFCYGMGVNDDEVFCSVLQRDYWKTCRVRNLGCIGYSTAHVLLRLEEEVRAGRKIDVCVYCWMWHHRFRNDRRRSWLKLLSSFETGQNPIYEVENGRPVFKGLIGVEQSVDDNDPALSQREGRVTYALLQAIQALCREHGIRLVVVMLPFALESAPPGSDASDRQMATDCRSLGIECLDLTGYRSLKDPAEWYPMDHHPRASWHKAVAELVAQALDPKTGRVRSHAANERGAQ